MGMALVIENPETIERIERLAAALGKPEVASVDAAVQEKLERMQKTTPRDIDWKKVREIQDWVAAQPVRDNRSSDELLEYNSDGLFD